MRVGIGRDNQITITTLRIPVLLSFELLAAKFCATLLYHTTYPRDPGGLSICMQKPVFSVGNQMERASPLEIFREK